MKNLLIIDDAQAALSFAPQIVQESLREAVERLRMTVIRLAAKREWLVVRHAEFAEWAVHTIEKEAGAWVSLDPLVRESGEKGQIVALRVSRLFGSTGAGLVGTPPRLSFRAEATRVGLLDDAIGAGRTVRLVQGLLAQSGAHLHRIVVCAAGPGARELVRQSIGSPSIKSFIAGEWRVAHLRDGCAFLPFAGQPTGRTVKSEDGVAIELRVQPVHLPGHPWQAFVMNPDVDQARSELRLGFHRIIENRLGRAPTVTDLALLGSGIPAMIEPMRVVYPDTPLDSI